MSVELYKHNKEAYEQVEEHFKTSNKTCVIHPTGTGKSFISLKFIDDNINKNILLLAPTNVILDQFCTNIAEQILGIETTTMSQKDLNDLVSNRFPNISFSTYANAKNQKKEYDCIVLDEFHRIGADTWGAGAKAIMDNNPDAKVLGMTATPIRYLDDMRDMSEELFDGDIASQMTLPEAIVKGILPVPTYISTLYSFEEDIDEIQKQIDNYKDRVKAAEYQKMLNKAKKELQSSEGLDEIFARNILNKNGRFIVFCRNYEHMKEMEQKCLQWFKKTNQNIEISEVFSAQSKELNQYNIYHFENNEKKSIKLLFSIEMLNEGLHVKNIDGVVMFRPTVSPIIYMQQLGRALSVGHNEHPLIFDIVNNANSLDSILDVKEQVETIIDNIIIERKQRIIKKDYPEDDILLKIKEGFKILEEQKEIVDVLNSLKVDTKFTWDDCYKYAKDYYEENGNLEVPVSFVTPTGFKLGKWIHAYRQAYKGNGNYAITPEQITLLKNIGMRFENIDHMEEWMKHYKEAEWYYKENGNLEVPVSFVTSTGFKLGLWIDTQRKAYQGKKKYTKTTPEQKSLLEKIGMRFDNIDKMKEWLKKYEEAKVYYEEYGDLKVPAKYVTPTGFKLGSWIKIQRKAFQGKGNYVITPEQKELLRKIGMRFEKIDKMEEWLKNYEEVKKYFKEHGNLDISQRYITSTGFNLGTWISTSRQSYRGRGHGKITPEQIKLLDEVEMIWFTNSKDDELQDEEINEKNRLIKQKEILNRFYSLLSKYDENSLPSKEEISKSFVYQLNRKKK